LYEEITNTPPTVPKCHTCHQPLTEVEQWDWPVIMTPYEIDQFGQLNIGEPWSNLDHTKARREFWHKPCSSPLNTAEVIWFTDMLEKGSNAS